MSWVLGIAHRNPPTHGGRPEKHSFEKVKIGGVGFCHSPTELPTEFGQLLKKRHSMHINATLDLLINKTSVADPNPDPDPPDPRVFGPPGSGSGSTSQRYGSGSGSCSGSGSGSFYYHATLIPTIL